ncbi:MAG: hypothetical protein QXU18_07460 [Thermoplasmatales archaeon]
MNEKDVPATFENIVSELNHALTDKEVREIVVVTKDNATWTNIGNGVKNSVHIANGSIVVGDPELGLSILIGVESVSAIRIEKVDENKKINYILVKFKR